MIKIRSRTVMAIAAFLAAAAVPMQLSAAGNRGKEPEWVNKPYSSYSENKYIAATGSGATEEEADKSAKAAVSSIISQNIQAEENVHQSATSNGEGLSTYLANIKTTTTVNNITGLSIADHYRQKKGPVYSLAVLDRVEAGKQYSMLVSRNTEDVEAKIEAATSAPATFQACADMLHAYQAAKDNDYYIRLLSAIRSEYRKIPSYGSSAAVGVAAQKAFNAVTVQMSVSGDTDDRIASAFASVINGMGIATAPAKTGKTAPYVLMSNVAYEDGGTGGNGAYFTRYTVTATLTETKSGRDLITFSRSGRAGKLSQSESQKAAVNSAEDTVLNDFATEVSMLFDSL